MAGQATARVAAEETVVVVEAMAKETDDADATPEMAVVAAS